jgi:hypothetical protein
MSTIHLHQTTSPEQFIAGLKAIEARSTGAKAART